MAKDNKNNTQKHKKKGTGADYHGSRGYTERKTGGRYGESDPTNTAGRGYASNKKDPKQ